MRILHTSDWHLGQNFMGKSREAEHRAFINWLLDTVAQQQVDAIIIAGDLFDTGTPPSYARRLYSDFIVSLKQNSDCQLVIVGGNHDSVSTLEESRELLAFLNVRVVGGVADTPAEQLIVLNDGSGQPGAVLCAIPFIRPRDVVTSHLGESQQDKQRALQAGIAEHYRTIHEAALALRERLSSSSPFSSPLPIIATGHLTTVGSSSSESVRDIYIGTLEALPADCLPAADYIALGHLHKPQTVAGRECVRYSGSPIPLSFDEAATEKQVLLVDFAEGKLERISALPVPRFQALRALRGSLAELESAIAELPLPDDGSSLWLEAEVREDDYLTDLTQRIQAMLADRPIELLRTRRARSAQRDSIARQEQETLAELGVEEVFARRLQGETLDEASTVRLQRAFADIVDSLGGEPAQTAASAHRETRT